MLSKLLDGTPREVIGRLNPCEPELISFRHEARTTCDGEGRDSSWRVVHCLAVDAEGKIAGVSGEIDGDGVKAVPQAGVAARLSDTGSNTPVKGNIYCTLPLPGETGLPVHLNGRFDLDSSRRSLTIDSGQTGAARYRTEWNHLLVKHVLSEAYAHLVEQLAKDFGNDDPERYYAHWPTVGLPSTKPLDSLASEVFKKLAVSPVIRVGNSDWRSPGAVKVIPPDWARLEDPLRAGDWSIPNPVLSNNVLNGFRTIKQPLKSVSPSLVHD